MKATAKGFITFLLFAVALVVPVFVYAGVIYEEDIYVDEFQTVGNDINGVYFTPTYSTTSASYIAFRYGATTEFTENFDIYIYKNHKGTLDEFESMNGVTHVDLTASPMPRIYVLKFGSPLEFSSSYSYYLKFSTLGAYTLILYGEEGGGDGIYNFCYQANGDCVWQGDDMGWYALYDSYGTNIPYIVYPEGGEDYYSTMSPFRVYVPDTYASTTISLSVRYGKISGSYGYETDKSLVFYTSLDREYDVYGNEAFPSTATSTWYAVADVYADYDGNGVYDDFLYTTSEVSWNIAPLGDFYYGMTSTSTGPVFYTSGGMPMASSTEICQNEGWIGRAMCLVFQWAFIPPDCNLMYDGSWSCPSLVRFGSLYGSVANKVPWGYFTLIKQESIRMASTVESTTTDPLPIFGYVSDMLGSTTSGQVRDITTVGIWMVVLLMIIGVLKTGLS